MQAPEIDRDELRFTLVSAVYRVEQFLPAFLASLEQQAGGLRDVELIFVSDGSDDDSELIIEAWLEMNAQRCGSARLIRKPNGGQASARNAGIDVARGEWISFPDPDDVLSPDYLGAVRKSIEQVAASDVPLLAARVMPFGATPLDAGDHHLLAFRFHTGSDPVHLNRSPRYIQPSAATSFFRRRLLEEHGLRFDEQLRVSFEDAHFTARYLLLSDEPVFVPIPAARYLYRVRPDGSSSIGTMWTKAEKYTHTLRLAHIPLLEQVEHPPVWLQNLVTYDLEWYFVENERPGHPCALLDPVTEKCFLQLLDQVLERIDARTLYAFSPNALSLRIRTALAVRKTGRLPWREARITSYDSHHRQLSLAYFSADEPRESVYVDGVERAPVREETEAVTYFGEVHYFERRLTVPADGAVTVEVDGQPLVLTYDDPAHLGAVAHPWSLAARAETLQARERERPSPSPVQPGVPLTAALARRTYRLARRSARVLNRSRRAYLSLRTGVGE